MPSQEKKVLIADDHGALQRGVRALLERQGNLRIVAAAAMFKFELRSTADLDVS